MTEPAVVLDDLSMTFRTPGRDVRALDALTATVPAGAIVGLLGRNGSGKTSLLRVLAGRDPRFTGSASVYGTPVRDLGRTPGLVGWAIGGWPGARDQSLASLLRSIGRATPLLDQDRARVLMERFGLPVGGSWQKLSQGKLSAARASITLAMRAPLTLLDEPQAAMDAPSRDLLTAAIIEEQELHPRTWVISTHLIDEAAPLFERVLVLDSGRLVTDAEVDELLARWVRVEADAETLASLPHLGELDRLGARASAILPVDAVPAGPGVRTHPLTLQALAGLLPLAPKE
ncbi:MAG: ATP-binding cassette domain-containing protein [Propionibacteriaceae bacterium]|nr:ATP-binding cassette domain-containing protein [Propionibacteriaceae bacterium]